MATKKETKDVKASISNKDKERGEMK